MSEKKVIKNLENIPIEDDDIAVDKRKFLDDNGVDIYSKKSGEKYSLYFETSISISSSVSSSSSLLRFVPSSC